MSLNTREKVSFFVFHEREIDTKFGFEINLKSKTTVCYKIIRSTIIFLEITEFFTY